VLRIGKSIENSHETPAFAPLLASIRKIFPAAAPQNSFFSGLLKTNMAKTTGWAERGARLIDHAPFGHWIEGPAAIGSRADPRANLHRGLAP